MPSLIEPTSYFRTLYQHDRTTSYAVTLVLLLSLVTVSGDALSADLRIAVSSNFRPTLERVVARFNKSHQHQHKIQISSASTGKLYAQIVNGAPFDVFLSADTRHPIKIIDAAIATPNSLVHYANGQLALTCKQNISLRKGTSKKNHSPDPLPYYTSLEPEGITQIIGKLLSVKNTIKLAIANPKVAPYGHAAKEVMNTLKHETKNVSMIHGENVSQAYNFVKLGASDCAIVPLSLAKQSNSLKFWIVDTKLYSPIKQSAVLLNRAKSKSVATQFLKYLRTPAAMAIIEESGYSTNFE